MDQILQDKFRDKVLEKYQEKAWESLLNYSHWGQKFAAIEKQLKEYQERIEHFEAEIKAIQSLPDRHTVENREKVKLMNQDIKDYEKRIKTGDESAKKIYEKSVGWQQQAYEFLEIAEHGKTFKVKTPGEIDADKHAPLKDNE